MIEPGLKLSNYRLSMFQNCPLKYKYHYIDHLQKKFEQEKPYLSIGISIHEALKDFFRQSEDKRDVKTLSDLLRKNWVRKGYSNNDEEREYGNKALRMLEDFCNNFDITVKPSHLERFFSIKLRNCELIGKIDRIDKLEDETYEIIDYKTGKYVKSQEEFMEDQQLAIYQLGAETDLGLQVSKVSVIYLEQAYKMSTLIKKEKIDETIKEVEKWADKILKEKIYEPTPNRFCDYCDFNIICPAMMAESDINIFAQKAETEQEKYELAMKQMDEMVKSLYLMHAVSKKINNVIEIDKLYSLIVEVFKDVSDMRIGAVFIKENNKLVLKNIDGLGKWNEKLVGNWIVPVGEGIIGSVAAQKKYQYIDDCTQNEEFYDLDFSQYKELKNRFKSMVVIPLEIEEEVIGVILLSNRIKVGSIFDKTGIILLLNLAGHTAIALKNAHNYTEAITDKLTGVSNRTYYENKIHNIIEDLKKNDKYITYLMIDIDHFKNVNDTYGHHIGDRVLKEIAFVIRDSVRPRDIVARYGGEEFVVLLVNAGEENGFLVAERLRKNVESKKIDINGDENSFINNTISIGMVSKRAIEVNSVEKLKITADEALYEAKRTGRNKTCIRKI